MKTVFITATYQVEIPFEQIEDMRKHNTKGITDSVIAGPTNTEIAVDLAKAAVEAGSVKPQSMEHIQ